MGKLIANWWTDVQPSPVTIFSGRNSVTTSTTPLSGMNSAITIAAGNLECVKVISASEGYVMQIALVQTAGTPVPFVMEVLTNSMCYPVGESPVSTTPIGTVPIYRILQQQSALSGTTLDITPDFERGWGYKNSGSDSTNNERAFFVVIIPTGAATETKWDLYTLVESNHD